MLTFTEAQVWSWVGPLLWPMLRVLALFTTIPVFSQRNVPARVRIGLAIAIVVCAQPSLPEMPRIALDSPAALLAVLQQVVIGMTLGFAARIVFTAVEFAGQIIGLQMGMNFSGFFDPAAGGESTAASSFFSACISWLFIVIGGHLLMIAAVVRSFEVFPVGAGTLAFLHVAQPQAWGAEIFRLGLWIAMPMIGIMLFVHLVLGVISRVASQMNIFSIGFPITMSVGLLAMLLTLPSLQAPFVLALQRALDTFQ